MKKELSLYSKKTNLILGFHGCDKSTTDLVMQGNDLKDSLNDYDWLGHGIYFWENNYQRALQWAKDSKSIKTPSVIGAVIDLGYCMDLLDSEFLPELKNAYETLETAMHFADKPMPVNQGNTPDKLLRKLDCAVFEIAHQINESVGNYSYDSVRAAFWEGGEIYPDAFFREKNHIQICIRNPNCIKGYFLPRDVNSKFGCP